VAGNQTLPTAAPVENYVAGYLNSYVDLLTKLGRHKIGKRCVSIKRLSDIDADVLRKVVGRSMTTSQAMGE